MEPGMRSGCRMVERRNPLANHLWPLMRAAVLLAALAPVGCASNRVPDGPPIQLHRGQFTYNSPSKQPVYDWFSLDPAFVAVLERHPPSLEEARRSTPFRTAYWISNLGAGVFIAKSLLTSLDDPDNFGSSEYEST